jgi:UDP-2,4-diacetamido-2,4,6-trideoxy-beta-L-altropyranose hydrolase
LEYYPDAAGMKNVMLESDIAISAGGQTLYELARIGVPTIGICVAHNQLQNVEGWGKTGFLKYIGWYNDENLEKKLKSSLKSLADESLRTDMSKNAREIMDGQGYKRIINAINTEYQNMVKVKT